MDRTRVAPLNRNLGIQDGPLIPIWLYRLRPPQELLFHHPMRLDACSTAQMWLSRKMARSLCKQMGNLDKYLQEHGLQNDRTMMLKQTESQTAQNLMKIPAAHK